MLASADDILNFGIRSTTAGRIGNGSSRKSCSQSVCTLRPSPTSGGGSQPQTSSALARARIDLRLVGHDHREQQPRQIAAQRRILADDLIAARHVKF